MKNKLVVLIGRAAAGRHEVKRRLEEVGVRAEVMSVPDLKSFAQLNQTKGADKVDIVVVWIKAPLGLRIERYLTRETDTLETRSRLVDQLISDGKEYHKGLGDELSYLIHLNLIKYWLTIPNPKTNLYRLDFIVDYIVDVLSEL